MQTDAEPQSITRPAKQSNQAKASAILIDCPGAAAATATIPSSYFNIAILTDCSVSTIPSYYTRSVLLLDLLDLLYYPAVLTDLFKA